MKLRPANRSLLAWMLYFSVLFSALACSMGHGQMAGLQLSGLDAYCSFEGNYAAAVDLDGSGIVLPSAASGSGCALSSGFSALLLAAFFGLLGLLPLTQAPRLGGWQTLNTAVRYLWPSANPRASPVLI